MVLLKILKILKAKTSCTDFEGAGYNGRLATLDDTFASMLAFVATQIVSTFLLAPAIATVGSIKVQLKKFSYHFKTTVQSLYAKTGSRVQNNLIWYIDSY